MKKSSNQKKRETEQETVAAKTPLRENIEAIVVALILALFVRTFIFQAFKIPSGSMKDTLLVGDHILVNKFIYDSPLPLLGFSLFPIRKPARKDVIVFKFPKDPKRDFIKRCIAKGNDIFQIRNNDVWVNNVKQKEEAYIKHEQNFLQSYQGRYWTNIHNHYGPSKLPPNKYFMMGDNRDNSQDSRYWGLLDENLIKGKAFLIYLSLNHDTDSFWEKIRWKRFFKRIY